ncbi:hypothetical protein ACFWDN_21095 [Micromonospora chalcea]
MTEQHLTLSYNPTGFEHDSARKSLRVEPSYAKAGDAFLGMDDESAYAYLSPEEARKLAEWFAVRYGVGGYLGAKAGETVKVVGRDGEVKRTVAVTGTVDSDGEYPIDGGGYVSAAFVRHADAILTAPAPSIANGTPVVIASDDAQDASGYRAGLPQGAPAVVVRRSVGSDPERSYVVKAMKDGELTEFFVRPQDIALTLPAEAAKTGPLTVGETAVFREDYRGGDFRRGDRARVRSVESGAETMIQFERISDGLRGGCYARRLERESATAPAPAGFRPQVGGEYRLLPNARMSGARCVLTRSGVTRVKVVSSADSDGDLFVTALDGTARGRGGYVLPSGLAPLS